jgi:hypothetical protein
MLATCITDELLARVVAPPMFLRAGEALHTNTWVLHADESQSSVVEDMTTAKALGLVELPNGVLEQSSN